MWDIFMISQYHGAWRSWQVVLARPHLCFLKSYARSARALAFFPLTRAVSVWLLSNALNFLLLHQAFLFEIENESPEGHFVVCAKGLPKS
jgi:hypothetical protein